jgi:hypothetical protein
VSAATQEQAAACLKHYFDQRVAEAMPAAFSHALSGPMTIAGWLYRAAAVHSCAHFGPLDEDSDLLFVGSLSVPTLLVLLLDKRQPAAVTVAARDALQSLFLADTQVKEAIRADAEGMARRAVQHLVSQQQLERAEDLALYGNEHQVTGIAPALVTREQASAVDDTAGLVGAEQC